MFALNLYNVDNYAMSIEWHIGDIVRKLRENVRKTQADLSKLTKLRPATISSIENTGKYDPESLERIAQALKTTVDYIYEQKRLANEKPVLQPTTHAFACPHHGHKNLHKMLEDILTSERPDKEIWIAGIASNLISMSDNATASGGVNRKVYDVADLAIRMSDAAAIDPEAKESSVQRRRK
jgi:transcriptional regulator with XRE-family HTH domain